MADKNKLSAMILPKTTSPAPCCLALINETADKTAESLQYEATESWARVKSKPNFEIKKANACYFL